MRYNDVLLEYKRDITVDRFGPKLMQRIKRDLSCTFYYHIIGNHDRNRDPGEGVVQSVERQTLNMFMHYVEQTDPTPNKEYVQWIVRTYIRGGVATLEDIQSTMADQLERYDEIKKSGYFKRAECPPILRPVADINVLRSLFDLRRVNNSVEPSELLSNNAQTKVKSQELIVNNEAAFIVNTPECSIMTVSSAEAAKFFGRNTQWCTAAKNNNAYHQYSKGNLYIILDKKRNRRWQLHFDTQSFMDENDKPITREDWDSIPKEALNDPAVIKTFYDDLKEIAGVKLVQISQMDFYPISQIARRALKSQSD